MSNKPTYFIDTEDEQMWLDMLEDMDTLTANSIYHKIKQEVTDSRSLASKTRGKTFEQLTYKNLRYILIGCKYCGAEMRVKALATFMFKASLPEPMNPLVDNSHLKKVLFDNLHNKMEDIYKWSGLEYES